MLILALDSTALSASVALCDDEHLLAEFTIHTGHTHSETLLPMVEAALAVTGRKTSDIELFACTAGPGSFTGVRIGTATIKGLAFGRDIPCIGISTLESLACNAIPLHAVLVPSMNARREQVYEATFLSDGQNLTRLTEDRALAIAELGKELANCHPEKPIYLMGDGAKLVYDALADTLGDRLRMLPERLLHQSGYNTAQIALRLYRSGTRTTDTELTPVYLRLSQAERVRMEKMAAESDSRK